MAFAKLMQIIWAAIEAIKLIVSLFKKGGSK